MDVKVLLDVILIKISLLKACFYRFNLSACAFLDKDQGDACQCQVACLFLTEAIFRYRIAKLNYSC